MTVSELIKQLQLMPHHMDVVHLWDGEPRTDIQVVYEAKGGYVVTSDFGMVCYSDEGREVGSDTPEVNRYWKTKDK